jgi:pilus assembly protein CpaB
MINGFTERISTSRGWTIGVGIGAAALAGLLLLLYIDNYRESVAAEIASTSVLRANSLIPENTPGTVIARRKLYEVLSVPKDEAKEGAILDPAQLRDRVTASDILPGQQLTRADFTAAKTDAVNTQITGAQRAISVAIDNVHGSLSQLKAGDRIDVYIGVGDRGGQATVKLFRENVLVLAVPSSEENGNLVLRVDQRDAADFAVVADNAQMYFTLRPLSLAGRTKPDEVTLDQVIAGG